ncbi:hypothetical protein COCOBI_03-5170 [Coccomyxa sp. Obi]|nr:hypothetical protein COCOBI_03-5170 [Coccomyxa sp. Obi]
MAKNSKRSSTKAARKRAGLQRDIGNKTAEELQDAAATIKSQAKPHDVVTVPKPAKAAVDNDSSSIPDCLSDGYISDCNPPTPELVPAIPSGVLKPTRSFETDGAASCACSTSDDEGSAPSEASCSQEETLGDLEDPLRDQGSQETLNIPSVAEEAAKLITECATTSRMDVAITMTDHPAAEEPLLARVEAEEGCICLGVWTFDSSPNMALCEASLAELLPTARKDSATIEPSKCLLDLLPASTQVAAAAEGTAVKLPPPDLGNLEAQVFAEVDEMCTGPDLWTCDFLTATAEADMTLRDRAQLRPPRASDAADASDRAPVGSLVAQQAHAATAVDKEGAKQGALVQRVPGKEEQPDAHKSKESWTSCVGLPTSQLLIDLFNCPAGLPSAQELITAPPAAPTCSCPAALALHACSHLQAASAHRWVQPRTFACIRLPLQLVAAAGVEATAFTAAVCQYAMSFAC